MSRAADVSRRVRTGVADDVREGGRWSLAQRAKNDLLYAVVWSAAATASRLPPAILRAFGRGLGRIARVVFREAARTADANLALAFPSLDPPSRRALVARTYRALGEHLGDAVGMLRPGRPAELLPFLPGARETLDAAIAEGRGVVFASAHLGPWERVAATIVAAGLPFTIVAREAYDPRLTRLYDRLRGGRGLETVYRGAKGAAAALLRVLRRGHVLGIPMDLASRVPSIDVPFLGIPASTPVGPARLALRTGAAVVVGVASPTPDGVLALRVERIETGDVSATADGERLVTARINEALSVAIRALPDQWVWMHPRFARASSPTSSPTG